MFLYSAKFSRGRVWPFRTNDSSWSIIQLSSWFCISFEKKTYRYVNPASSHDRYTLILAGFQCLRLRFLIIGSVDAMDRFSFHSIFIFSAFLRIAFAWSTVEHTHKHTAKCIQIVSRFWSSVGFAVSFSVYFPRICFQREDAINISISLLLLVVVDFSKRFSFFLVYLCTRYDHTEWQTWFCLLRKIKDTDHIECSFI